MKRNNDETLESPAKRIHHKYTLSLNWKLWIEQKTLFYIKCDNHSREETFCGNTIFISNFTKCEKDSDTYEDPSEEFGTYEDSAGRRNEIPDPSGMLWVI